LKLSVVIAAYDERENVEELARRLDRTLRALPGVDSEMIFVVEGRDGTREILEGLDAEIGRIRVLYSEKPGGLGRAFRRGFAAISPDTDFVVTMDADLNHQPEELPRLLDERERVDADLLIGSRFVAGSQSQGIPLWKRAVSGLMNKIIGSLFDVEALDKSSGFRIYRAAALRRLTDYRNDDFAFLPEMLIRGTVLGMRIAEAPIHFTFRTRGVSKMSILQTTRSYLALLRTRFDRLSVAAVALLAIGAAVRLAYAFPTHRYPTDADSLLTGLRALDILEGKLRVFYSGVRIGALESYMHVPFLWLLGVTRAAVSIAPLLSGIATLAVFFFFVREILGRRTAALALLFLALPSPAYLTWTYLPNGYPETILICCAVLYVAARIARTGHKDGAAFALGLFAGLGIWQSIQTLTCTIPAALWLVARRPDVLRRGRFWALGAAGAVLGATPWILYNLVHPFATFEGNFAMRAAASASSVASNTAYFFRYNLREILIGVTPFRRPPTLFVSPIGIALQSPAAAAYVFALAALVLVAHRRNLVKGDGDGRDRSGAQLLLWVAATITFLDIVSAAGEKRGFTVRYVLPLYLVAAAALGLLVTRLWPRRRVLAAAALAAVLALNLGNYYWPWTAERRYWRQLDGENGELLKFLEARKIAWICGNYWIVYPMNFLSARKLIAVPFNPGHDQFGYADRLPPRPTGWALVGRNPEWLARWAQTAAIRGNVVEVDHNYHVFLPDPEETRALSPRKTLALLIQSATWGN
jgi:dolichol-phosphate mannosyltransferase